MTIWTQDTDAYMDWVNDQLWSAPDPWGESGPPDIWDEDQVWEDIERERRLEMEDQDDTDEFEG